MRRKLTLTVDEMVYEGLHRSIGGRRISQFIESLVRPHVLSNSLADSYAEMAKDEEREAHALHWAEGLIGDIADEQRGESL